MEDVHFQIQQPGWFLPLCIIVGAAYAWLLYRAKSPWSTRVNRVLGGVRFVLVSTLCFFLLDPMLNAVENTFEKPIVVMAVDNSSSMVADQGKEWEEASAVIEQAKNQFEQKGFDVRIRSFDGEVDSLGAVEFSIKETNLNRLLERTVEEHKGLHLDRVILVSDGIYNKGSSPKYQQYGVPVDVLALGDTVPKKDVNLKLLKYNKLSFLGNEFPIVADVQHFGFANQRVLVSLSHNGAILETKEVVLGLDGSVSNVEFLTTAKDVGTQHYLVSVNALDGEFSKENNLQHAYIDVVDERQKIVVFAASPHPDIKMLKSIIDQKEKYELIINIVSAGKKMEEPDDVNLVIFHQLPNSKVGGKELVQKYQEKGVSQLHFVGNRSDLKGLNEVNNCINVVSSLAQSDEVTAVFNDDFDKFTLEFKDENLFSRVPPVQVPFGDYGLKGNAEVIMYQQLGSIQTPKPLIAFREDGEQKAGVIIAEDLWRWRLFEFLETEATADFDMVISKLLQLLVTKNDKRKLRVRPTQEAFNEVENPTFSIETYNAIYEKTYGETISLSISGESGGPESYSIVNVPGRAVYPVKPLPEGVYDYVATSNFGGESHRVRGSFVVTETKLESAQLTANHGLLRSIANKSKGKFYAQLRYGTALQDWSTLEARQLIHSSETESPLVHYWWILFFFVTLASIEWAARKAFGGY